MSSSVITGHVEAVRRFNRFYTQQLGLLQERGLYSPFSLAEARVLYELANREKPTATELAGGLGLDPGYLSRILRGFAKGGLLSRTRASQDGRQVLLSLTPRGRSAFAKLNAMSLEQIGALLATLPATEQSRLVAAMDAIGAVLGPKDSGAASYLLRPHGIGDMGWVIRAHGELYAQEYGWDGQFEALVAEIAAKFLQNYDPKREQCWIAEVAGEPAGSVFVVKQSATVAKLRLLIVDPRARGLGIGKRLVEECIRFARQAGYRKLVLWTNSVLHAARHIYVEAGFTLIREEPHHSFGKDLVGETWELKL